MQAGRRVNLWKNPGYEKYVGKNVLSHSPSVVLAVLGQPARIASQSDAGGQWRAKPAAYNTHARRYSLKIGRDGQHYNRNNRAVYLSRKRFSKQIACCFLWLYILFIGLVFAVCIFYIRNFSTIGSNSAANTGRSA
jgi:hypothetical protein